MARTTTQAIAFARAGLDRIVPLYTKDLPKHYEGYTALAADNKQEFIRVATLATLPAATTINQASGVGFYDLKTPFYQDNYFVKRGSGVAFTDETLLRDVYKVWKGGEHLAMADEKARKADFANFINLGTSSITTPDGVALFSASHILANGATASNLVAGSLVLSVFALETAVQGIMSQPDHNGDPIDYAGPYALVVPPSLAMLANRIVKASYLPQSNDNDPNVVNSMVTKVIVDPFFTSTTAWALVPVSAADNPLKRVIQQDKKTKYQYAISNDTHLFANFSIWTKYAEDWRRVTYSAGS